MQVAHGSREVQRDGASVAVPLQVPLLVGGKSCSQVPAWETRTARLTVCSATRSLANFLEEFLALSPRCVATIGKRAYSNP